MSGTTSRAYGPVCLSFEKRRITCHVSQRVIVRMRGELERALRDRALRDRGYRRIDDRDRAINACREAREPVYYFDPLRQPARSEQIDGTMSANAAR